MEPPGATVSDGEPAPGPGVEHVAGDHLAGRYEVRGVLGRGAGTCVYRVLDHAIGEEIAVKTFAERGVAARLAREVQLARKVTHENVCRVFDLVEYAGGALVSMELVDGGTLADRAGSMPATELRDVARQLLAGLAAAHAAGVVHRDLKPANVLRDRSGRIVLTDFGIARPTADGDGDRSGTPRYMAPEQLEGQGVGPPADVYAAGLVLNELAASRPDPRLAVLIERMSERRPGDRPTAVAALAILDGAPAVRRRRQGAIVAVAVAAAAAATLAVATLATPTPERAAVSPPPAPPPRPRTLSSDDGVLDAPVLMPGGDALVIASNRGGGFQLWRVALATGEARPLTDGPRAKHAPRVAGEWLYFLVDRDDGGGDLVRLPLAALDRVQRGDDAEIVRSRVGAADVAGATIAVTEVIPGLGLPARITVTDRSGNSAVAVDLGGRRVRAFALSPDGARLAVLTRGHDVDGQLLIGPTRGRLEPRGAPGAIGSALAWYPDGSRVAVLRGPDPTRTLHAVDPDRGEEREIAALPDVVLFAIGAGVVVAVTRGLERDLWLRDGSRLRRLTFLGDGDAVSPTWAATADLLGYLVVGSDATEFRLTTGPTYADVIARRPLAADPPYAVLSRSGAQVAFVRQDGEESVLAVTDPSHPDAPLVDLARARSPAYLLPADISADEERVIYAQVPGDGAASSLYDVPVRGGAPRLLAAGAGGGFQSVDGRWMLEARVEPGGPASRTYVVALDPGGAPAGAPRPVAADRPLSSFRFAGDPPAVVGMTDRHLYRIAADGTMTALAELPVDTVDPHRIAVHPRGPIVVDLGVGRQRLQVVALPAPALTAPAGR